MTTNDVKVLSPQLPPGRADRKALGYTGEIQRLRALGYTFPAIRLALADVGVQVSLTTVKREAAQRVVPSPRPVSPSTPMRTEDPLPATPGATDSPPVAPHRRSGRQIAEEFVQSHVSHPLLRAQLPGDDNDASESVQRPR